MFLVWLRCGFGQKHLAWLFDIGNSTVSRFLITWSNYRYFCLGSIGLITVSDAILTGRQSGQKLQCLYGNPMANNFFQNRILHKL